MTGTNERPTLDNNTKEMIGKIFFVLSLSTDPANTIRLTDSAISLVRAGLHKIGCHQYDTDLEYDRKLWKKAKTWFTSGRQGWSTSEDMLSDIRDFLYDIAIEKEIMIIRAEWYNLSSDQPAPVSGAADPMEILRSISTEQ